MKHLHYALLILPLCSAASLHAVNYRALKGAIILR